MNCNVKKKVSILLMAIACILVLTSLQTSDAYGETKYGTSGISGKLCTSDSYAASAMDYMVIKYPHSSHWTLGGQCFGFAERSSSLIGSSRVMTKYDNTAFNKENFRKLCLNLKAGAHLRLSRYKKYDPYHGHSILLLKVTDEEVIWADNNYAGSDIVYYYKGTLDDFMNAYWYPYLNAITKVTKYRKHTEPSLGSATTSEGSIKLSWTKTYGATSYKIYRATSKFGTYKAIKTTTSRSYTYNTAALGVKYYYKVRAVKSGTDVYSDVTSRTRRLKKPTIKLSNDTGNGYIKISWGKITGATGYAVYRRTSNSSQYSKIKTTESLSYIDTKARTSGMGYYYKVKALYSKNSNGDSSYSSAKLGYPRFSK